MSLDAAFDRLWPAYCADVGFDDALFAEAAADDHGVDADAVEQLLLRALERNSAELNVHGASLAALLIEALGARALGAAAEALARLQEPEVMEDLSLDSPLAPAHLAEVEAMLGLGGGRRRLRVLAVRNGFAPESASARALRCAVELRVPGSPYIAETGNEDAQGRGEQDMAQLLRAHLRAWPVDLVLAHSRGCRLVLEQLVGGEDPCWRGPVLALSPAGELGEALLGSGAGAVLVAASGNDLVELCGGHSVLQRDDVERLRAAAAAHPARRAFVFEEDRCCGWADAVAELVSRAAALGAAGPTALVA